MDLIQRPRRLRGSENLRKMVRETRMDKSSLIYPLFVKEGTGIEEEIPSMEGQFRYSVDRLPFELERLQNAGVNSIMLFGIPDHKDEVGSGAYDPNGIVQKALREAKKQFPDMYYITDVCMCEYTSHGHCGVLCGHDVNNDATLELLAKTAVSHVEAGADMVAPSDMMDGRVRAIREALDANGHYGAPIMSYAVKYASAFYGPFRDAAGSAPSFGDRKSYQMDFHNRREGMKEALTDVEEGAPPQPKVSNISNTGVTSVSATKHCLSAACVVFNAGSSLLQMLTIAIKAPSAAALCHSHLCRGLCIFSSGRPL